MDFSNDILIYYQGHVFETGLLSSRFLMALLRVPAYLSWQVTRSNNTSHSSCFLIFPARQPPIMPKVTKVT
ncbi:hypothetical protein SAMN05421848_3221 [Kushneria avicenniae]|uniref:Uncharacterized protein n=1 Tax=Kushneria avicenniae TaxID=402385 RepID=A0A1I1MXG8_9GAMM|nr:hypothetical protein SAMN05421848_3221 [Kushneria avicenniae]